MFTRTNGILDSVVDPAPYNSCGTQSFRTLLSAKLGSNRWMVPYDGYLKPLPHDPEIVLRGFISITNHPDRKHDHKSYRSILSDAVLESIYQSTPAPKPMQLSTRNSGHAVKRGSAVFGSSVFSMSSVMIPLYWTPASDVDKNDVYALLNAFPMMIDGAKQSYNVWVSLFFAFSRSGITFNSF